MSNDAKNVSEESTRMWASAAFVGVLIIIGVPLWWKTTAVYRVPLPHSKIDEFGTEKLVFGVEVTVVAGDEQIMTSVVEAVNNVSKESDFIKIKINTDLIGNKWKKALKDAKTDRDAVEILSERFDFTQYNHIFIIQKSLDGLDDVWMSNDRVMFVRDAAAAKTITVALSKWVYQIDVVNSSFAATEADVNRRTRFAPNDVYDIVLSVVHPRPDLMKVDLDAGQAVEDYIGSFVDDLRVLHNFTLKSQWLHLLEFNFNAQQVKTDDEWKRKFELDSTTLPGLVTKLETRAATRVSHHPTINLALYIMPCNMAPLYQTVYSDKQTYTSTAFKSAKWGGVVVGNPTYEECHQEVDSEQTKWTYKPNLTSIMGNFIAHLRSLLGIVEMDKIPQASMDNLTTVAPRSWEVDALLRMRTIEQITSAQLTLKSLSQLLAEISNIVITDEVATSVKSSVRDIEAASRLLESGELVAAYRTSLAAFLAAEAAFNDPSLLSLLYFPDDQKYAVYIPLFLPIMFPVLLSLKNLLLWLRGKSAVKDKLD